jgi:hypothetical protein
LNFPAHERDKKKVPRPEGKSNHSPQARGVNNNAIYPMNDASLGVLKAFFFSTTSAMQLQKSERESRKKASTSGREKKFHRQVKHKATEWKIPVFLRCSTLQCRVHKRPTVMGAIWMFIASCSGAYNLLQNRSTLPRTFSGFFAPRSQFIVCRFH